MPVCGAGSAIGASDPIAASAAYNCVRWKAEPFGGMFGDPDDLQRRLGEFAEQMQGAQRVAWADNAIKLAVDMTVAAIHAHRARRAARRSRPRRSATRSG